MKFSEKIKFIGKVICEIHKLQPGLLFFVILKSLLETLPVYIEIYLSAKIVDMLVNKCEAEQIVCYMLVLIGAILCIELISKIVEKHVNILKQVTFKIKSKKKEAEKFIGLKYEDIERPAVHELFQKIKNIELSLGDTLGGYLDVLERIFKSLFSVVYALMLCGDLVVSLPYMGGISGFMCSYFGLIFLAVAIVLMLLISSKATACGTKIVLDGFSSVSIAKFIRKWVFYEDMSHDYKYGKDIRLYKMEEIIRGETFDNLSVMDDCLKGIEKKKFLPTVLKCFSSVFSMLVFYVFVGIRAIAGMFDIGSIVQYVRCLSRFADSISEMSGDISVLFSKSDALRYYFQFMELAGDDDMLEKAVTKPLSDMRDFEFEFSNVSFKYPGAKNFVLKNINLKIKSGDKIAIVGANGSGKTTFIKLLCRLYDPDEGKITLNGADIKTIPLKDYRAFLSVVFQDFRLFAFNIAENVAASDEYSAEQVEKCLALAGFSERLEALPRGIDTSLFRKFETDGVEISGGEAQKIAIARSLYKKSELIVLDEPTAALDPISEAEIYERFEKITGERTAIYISHRLSSCKFCEKIVVFKDGHIHQEGDHTALMTDENGEYYRLWSAQAGYYA